MDARRDELTAGQMNGRTQYGHNAMTIARWPSASGAKSCLRNFDLSINMALVNCGFVHSMDMKKFLIFFFS